MNFKSAAKYNKKDNSYYDLNKILNNINKK